MKATRSYLICCAARTGSNLLATTLRRTGVAGKPFEHFDPGIFANTNFLKRMGVPADLPMTDVQQWLDYVTDNLITANGVFGSTIHWPHVQPLCSALAERNIPGARGPAPVKALQSFFPDLRFVWLRRMNKVAQAISHLRAIDSGVWFVDGKNNAPAATGSREPAYDFAKIDEMVAASIQWDEDWARFLAPVADRTLELHYEDMNSDFESAVVRVLRHLDLAPTKAIGAAPFRKQADQLSLDWEREYRKEAQNTQNSRDDQIVTPSIESGSGGAPSGTIRKRICFVTTEFHGLFRNGGIGTANTGLALALAAAGHDVTVAYANADENGPRLKQGNFDELRVHYAAKGVNLDYTPPDASTEKGFNEPRSASYSVYSYLKAREFDIVFFHDCGGLGYFSLLAKFMGTYRNPPLLCVVAHGPMEWVRELNALPYTSRSEVAGSYLERRCIELADILVSPSRYLLDWMIAHGWKLPSDTRVLQNIVQVEAAAIPADQQFVSRQVKEIVFFGRLEVRKGLELFCNAVDLLEQQRALDGIQITFLGKFDKVAGLHSGPYILERTRQWNAPVRLIVTYDQPKGLSYLAGEGRLAVVPSLAENSPCVVLECLQLGIPFIATDSGGTGELVAEEDRAESLCELTPAALASRLHAAIVSGHRPVRMAHPQAEVVHGWEELVRANPKETETAPAFLAEPRPLVSVCLAKNPGDNTGAFLDSILQQTHGNIEIVIGANDGELSLVRLLNKAKSQVASRQIAGGENGPGARNACAREAKGKYLLFLDEPNVTLAPECVEILVAAAEQSGADVVTGIAMEGGSDLVRGGDQIRKLAYLPIGASIELGALENCFGEGVVLVRRDFLAGRDLFQFTGRQSFEDWLFLVSAAAEGAHVALVPEPLFWLRSQIVDFNPSDAMRQHRRILESLGKLSFANFLKIAENLLDTHRNNQLRIQKFVVGFGKKAGELAGMLSSGKLDESGAKNAFFQYCLERDRTREALDFAMMNDPPALPEALAAAGIAARALALDQVRQALPEFTQELALADIVAERIRPVWGLSDSDVKPLVPGIATQPVMARTTILKAIGACPPGAISLDVVAELEGQATVDLAFAACPPGVRLVLGEDGFMKGGAAFWSGWTRAESDGAPTKLSLAIPDPFAAPLDLFLLSRCGEGHRPEGSVIWRSVSARILINGTMSPSAIELETRTVPISESARAGAVLLTNASGHATPVFVPGEKILLRPIIGKTVLARYPRALPSGARGIRCRFSIEHEESGDVEFGFWLRPCSMPAEDSGTLTSHGAFSGWIKVQDRFKLHQATLQLPKPTDEEFDLYLATRVQGLANAGNCRAMWHELHYLE